MKRTPEELKAQVISILKSHLGGAEDNLFRVKHEFRYKTDEEYNLKWLRSGKTCREIVDSYQETFDRTLECIQWVEMQGDDS